ncbi:MAG: helicase, partial [Candidatus Aenigmatarchaeota archaeon]
YFNAIRELAGARSLYRQDIPERLRIISEYSPRNLSEDNIIELSSRVESTRLPVLLERLEAPFSGNPEDQHAVDALFTTSMFGTGVDVSRLSLMVVHGQPKTTASYIQSTGRVGRSRAGLVVTFYRATRPRDMSHYEMFCGYHLNMERFVEAVTVAPYSPGTLERCTGPVAVAILRNMSRTTVEWHREDSAGKMAFHIHSEEVKNLPKIFGERSENQPPFRRPERSSVERLVNSELERWRNIAQQVSNRLKYAEYWAPRNPVVLGDPQHRHRGLPVVYENAPNSLRDIEETTGFDT